MHKPYTLTLTASLVLTLLSHSALSTAAEGFNIGGFVTLGFNADDGKDMAPVRDISQTINPATDARWETDSRAGLQIEYGVSASTALIGQVVLRDQFKPDLNNAVELAYLALNPQPAIDLRLGRINYDTFMLADIRNVSYAYPWVRPPIEFYGWVPIFSLNGADAAYSTHWDDALWRLKLQAGKSQFSFAMGTDPAGYDFESDGLVNISLSRQTARWNIKTAYSQFSLGNELLPLAPLQHGLAQVAAGSGAIAAEANNLLKDITFKAAKITYSTLGAAYDDGIWNLQSEIGHTTSTAALAPQGNMAYLSIARRMEEWTPYLLLSTYRARHAIRTASNDWGSNLNATLRDPAVRLPDMIRINQSTISIGTRWDFLPHAALKLQLDSTKIQPYGWGLMWRESHLLPEQQRMTLLSASLDFVF